MRVTIIFMPTQYWLLKTEPEVFSFEDLLASPDQRTMWEGVRNYQARNFLRAMRAGDKVLLYHSNCKPPGVVGIAEVVTEAYPDPAQFDGANPYFDPKSSEDNPRWTTVDIKGLRKLARFVALPKIKEEPTLAGMKLVQRGNRLSVMPVKEAEFNVVLGLGEACD